MTPLIVAIDGPSGVGKTTTSKLVAAALGIPHIDTGAMYRAAALKARRSGVSLDDAERLAPLVASMSVEFRVSDGRSETFLDGESVEGEIRTQQMSMEASRISAVPAVRRVLVDLQQRLGRKTGGVLEGRDIGTKVFPETPHKFFLTASPQVRSGRRVRDLQAKGMAPDPDVVHAELIQRDAQDSSRADSPLTCDDSYTVIDTSDMTIDDVVDRIVSSVRLCS